MRSELEPSHIDASATDIMPDANSLIENPAAIDGFTVRDATPGDARTIADFNVAMALETEQRDLDDATVRAGVQAVFDEPSRGNYIVAETLSNYPKTCRVISWSSKLGNPNVASNKEAAHGQER